jgi:predicted nucleic acid-binding Zn ribbon protein
MAKKTTETPATTTPAETKETKMAETPTTTALTTTSSALALNQALAARLPESYHESVMLMERPTPVSMMQQVAALPTEWQDKTTALIRRMRPQKQGVHTKGSGFKIAEIRLYQGTGSDPARPAKMAPGGFYTDDSREIETPFVGAILGLHETRTMWPPRDGSVDSKGPLCYSLDSVQGSRYGLCSACPNAAKLQRDGGCGQEVVAYVVDREMTGIYSIKFSKTSLREGRKLIRLVQAGDEIWSRWISFAEQEYKEGSKRWFGYKVGAVESKNPADVHVPQALDPIFRALSQALDAEVYYPALADLYDRSKTGGGAVTAGLPAETFEPLANPSGNPDYSL